ncbi:MAG: hypothetical protein V1644_01895 [Candidatus Micrarchaeota archaeon]
MAKVQWKTHTFRHNGEVYKVTHWAKHNPREILKALKEPSSAEIEHLPLATRLRLNRANPKIHIFKFGPHLLVKRDNDSNDQLPTYQQMNTLMRMVQDKTAVVEMPFAFVQKKRRTEQCSNSLEKEHPAFI